MKKVNFFKVMSAFVAFSAMTLASCTEEKMTITSPTVDIPAFVLPDAKATVSVSVYDLESNTILGVTNVDATPGQAMTVECPAYEGYIVAQPISVEIPSLVAGQVAVVPVTFFVVTEGSAKADIVAQLNAQAAKEKPVAAESVKYSEVVRNESNKVRHGAFEGKVAEGYKFVSVAAAESRAAATGAEFIEEICGGVKFTEKNYTFFKYWLNPWHQATLSAEQEMATVVYTVEFNGVTYDVTFTKAGAFVKKMVAPSVMEEYKHNWEHVLLHGHAGHDYHGHGHGSENAGGGIVDAE